MTFRKSLLAPLFIFGIAAGCGGGSSDDSGGSTAGDTTAGDTTAGDTTAGDTTAGDTTAGDTTAGDTTGGDTTAGDGGTTTGGGTTGGFSDAISGNVQFLGFLGLIEDVADNEVSASGSFIRFTSSIAGNLVAGAFTPALDQCEVETVDAADISDLPDIDTDVVPELVSAGEVIPLTSSAGTFIQLMRQSVFGFTLYIPEPETVAGPMPANVTVDIPGDVFPAFAGVVMPTVASLEISAPIANEIVTPSTVFSWTAGTNPDAFISISTSTFDAGGQTTVVDCQVADDGSFTFPAATQAAMGEGFMGLFSDVQRQVITVQQQGNAVLLLSANSGS